MKIFRCPSCKVRVYFENLSCLQCGTRLVFDPDIMDFASQPTQACSNRDSIDCNWAAQPADDVASTPSNLCRSCAANQTIPPADSSKFKAQWARTEQAKRRLLWSLLRLCLWQDDISPALSFRLMTPDAPLPSDIDALMIGHADGTITLDISEASASVRHDRRENLGEEYRTLLGHFRHEASHYIWDALIQGSENLTAFRDTFGDERTDYQSALAKHYKNGPPENWEEIYVSFYASSHPWEDWAETSAHVLHIIDLVETDLSFEGSDTDALDLPFEDLLSHWFPLIERQTSLSRSLGHEDPYPFVITQTVRSKLHFAWKTLLRVNHSRAVDLS